jgi:hypothetical protein
VKTRKGKQDNVFFYRGEMFARLISPQLRSTVQCSAVQCRTIFRTLYSVQCNAIQASAISTVQDLKPTRSLDGATKRP